MADGVPITAGSGTTVATDDTGANGHAQLFKLAYSANGDATLVQVDANGVLVNTELPAAAALSDAIGNPTTPMVGGAGMVWDGSQWVRIRATSILSSAQTAGVPAVGLHVVNDSSDTIFPVHNVASTGDGDGGNRMLPAGMFLYNGSNWDRPRGDTTNGLWVNVKAGQVGLAPSTSGGLTTYHLMSAATTNATVVKASAGQLFGWYLYNSNAAARKLVFHNTASTPTAGASVFFSVIVPPLAGANVEYTNGIAFSTGISITTVTGLADNDTVAVAANDLTINLFYK